MEQVATYDYHDAAGEMVYQVVRYQPKTFRQRRPDGHGGWIWNVKGVTPVLYRLPEVLSAVAAGETVYVVEGEKDANNLARVGEVCATTSHGGAGKFGVDHASALAGANVVIVADRDEAGRKHAEQVASMLSLVGATWTVMEAAEGKDATDHLQAGHTVSELVPVDITAATETVEDEPDPKVAHLRPAGEWMFTDYEEKPAIWGRDDEVLWPDDEGLIIAAPTGVGKTTLANLIVRASIGLGTGDVLGYPISECDRVLYLAMDRPAQIRRAMRRVFSADDIDHIDKRLIIHPAPLTADLGHNPWILAELAELADADRVVIDSVKDTISKVSDDESGGNFNRAIQLCNAAGVPTCGLHHQRKAQNGAKPTSIEDVYGSTWITAGAGSVLLLWGEPGTGRAELHHLKTPASPVGPIDIEIDTFAGTMTILRQWDPLTWLRRQGERGGTVPEAGQAMAGKAPTTSEREKARRKLDGLVARGLAKKVAASPPATARYWATGDDIDDLVATPESSSEWEF
jgi:5S rRNA maturation endonuclease (ribonuclease M5)